MNKNYRYKNYHNYRSANGQFAPKPRAKSKNHNIVPGRLYSFQGITCRAGHLTNGKRVITAHKVLSGFVSDHQLKTIDKGDVNSYLVNA